MKVVIALMLVSGACCHPVREMILGGDNSLDELVRSYLTISDNDANERQELHWFSLVPKLYLQSLHQRVFEDGDRPAKSRREIQTAAYWKIQTTKQKGEKKSYYLSLCHFKICNMGKKRTTKFLSMESSLDDET